MKTTSVWKPLVLSLVAAGPTGGFLFGILNAGDPDPNPVGRVAYAFMMAGLTPLHGGFPPHAPHGGTHFANAWPHMVVSFVLILGWLLHRNGKAGRQGSATVA